MPESKAAGVGRVLGAPLGVLAGLMYGSTYGTAVGWGYFIGGAVIGAAVGALLGWFVRSQKTALSAATRTWPRWPLWLARGGAILAALGLTDLVSGTSRWYIDRLDVQARFFWMACVLAVGVWMAFRHVIPVSGRRARQIGHVFASTMFGATALLLGLLAAVTPTTEPVERTYVATMRSDLLILATAEEETRSRTGAYAQNLPDSLYVTSPGVTGLHIALTADGWAATVEYAASRYTCTIFIGSTPLAPALQKGTPFCSRRSTFPKPGVGQGLGIIVAGAAIAAIGILLARPAVNRTNSRAA